MALEHYLDYALDYNFQFEMRFYRGIKCLSQK